MFILDTNVVSELRKVRLGKASEPVAQFPGRQSKNGQLAELARVGRLA